MTSCDLLNSFCHLLLYLLSSTISFLSDFFRVIFNRDPKRNLTSPDQHLLISILSLCDCRGTLQYSLKPLILTELENTRILKQVVQIKNQFPENPYKTGKQKTMAGEIISARLRAMSESLCKEMNFWKPARSATHTYSFMQHVTAYGVLRTPPGAWQARRQIR